MRTSKTLVILALTALAVAAVEEKNRTKKRGLEDVLQLQQVQPHHQLLDLGSLNGFEQLKSYEALGHSFGSSSYGYGNLYSAQLYPQHQALTLALHNGNLLLGKGPGLYDGLSLGNGYFDGHGLDLSQILPPLPLKGSAPVSVPDVVAPAQALPQPNPVVTSAGNAPGPLTVALPIPTGPAPTAAIPTKLEVSPAPAIVIASTPAPVAASAPTPAPLGVAPQVPAPAPAKPQTGTLGSGSLGYVNLGNGAIALGSGSLGFASLQPAPAPQQQNTRVNLNSIHQGAFGVPFGYGGQGASFDSGYGGLSLNGRLGSGLDINENLIALGGQHSYGFGLDLLGKGN